MRAVHRRKDDEVFKKEEFERFNKIFHIGLKSRDSGASSSIEKSHDELNNSKVGTK